MNLAAWIRTRRPTQIYYGWWIAAASCAMMFLASGTFFRGFIVFFVPVRDSLGITNFQTSLVFSLSRAEGGLEGPGGRLDDRPLRDPQVGDGRHPACRAWAILPSPVWTTSWSSP